MTGGGVNQKAQSAEQANQQKAQQYAAQQQAASLAQLDAWLKGNPSPNSTAAPLQPPGAASPATMGGGTAPGSAQPQGQMRPPGGQPGAAPGGQPNPLATLPPQLKAALMAHLGQQGAPAAPKAM
jgi:hypothetical protein